MEVTRCLWLFQSCSGNAHKISCLKMYAKYNLGCTYNLFLGDPEKRLSRENLFLKSRSRFFRPCFPSAVLSSASSFFPLCQLILSVIPAAPGSRSLSVKTSALLGCTWWSLDLLLSRPERVPGTQELSGDHWAASWHQMKQIPALKNPAGTKWLWIALLCSR